MNRLWRVLAAYLVRLVFPVVNLVRPARSAGALDLYQGHIS